MNDPRAFDPFADQRWELTSGPHFFNLEGPRYERLCLPRHNYLVGHRGTGKTTLLRALNWYQRSTNSFLAEELCDRPYADRILGVYFGARSLPLEPFREWLAEESDATRSVAWGFLLRVVWLKHVAEAAASLESGTHCGEALRYLPPKNDHALDSERDRCHAEVARLWAAWHTDQVAGHMIGTQLSSFRELELVAKEIEDEIVDQLLLDVESPRESMSRLRAVSFNRMCDALFKVIMAHFDSIFGAGWTLRLCIDEGEHLQEFEERVLNTMVREFSAPVFLTYATMRAPTALTVSSHVLADQDDRQLISLDSYDVAGMRSLLDGLCKRRIRYALRDIPNAPEFPGTISLLGEFDPNEVLLTMKTENPDLRRLQLEWKGRYPGNTGRRAPSPIRSFLEEAGFAEPLEDEDQELSRRRDSSGYRRRAIATYLRMCRDFKVEPRYYGSNVMFSICDGSVRACLEILHEMFDAYKKFSRFGRKTTASEGLIRFMSQSPLDLELQHRSIRHFSDRKVDSFAERVLGADELASRLIAFFGEFTYLLQVKDPDGRAISSPERGLVNIDWSEGSARISSFVRRTIIECAKEGYLAIDSEGDDTNSQLSEVRLHRSLSPHFGVSYRGPYQPARTVPATMLYRIAFSSDEEVVSASIRAIERELRSGESWPEALRIADDSLRGVQTLFDIE